jgi:hypothetical protein
LPAEGVGMEKKKMQLDAKPKEEVSWLGYC